MNAMFAALLDVRTAMDYLLYLGAILLVALGVMIWAVAFRKTGKTRRRRRKHRERPTAREDDSESRSERRRRRREARRNPTRAEVGGLPPLRDHSAGAAADQYKP
jgi:Flp pilus assembly protein TadB